LEDLQDYFTAGGLGGQALVSFAAEVSQYRRKEGVDYKKSGPTLLLMWGERKFTGESNLPEVIESLARVEWLVLNENKRVHEDPGFGRCLKLREQEATLFWRLVWKLRDANPLEPGTKAYPASAPPAEANIPAHKEEIRPQETATEELPQATLGREAEEEPGWVTEVAAMLDRDGPLDYGLIKGIVAERTGRGHGLFHLVANFFEIDDQNGKFKILRRKP